MAADLRAVTKFFLDRAELQRKVERGQLRVLGAFGAFVHRGARSSIRKGKKSAAPGRPPKSHRGDLRRLIFFSVDPAARSTVVGPVIFDSARRQSRHAQEALEYGGPVTRRVRVPAAPRRRAAPGQAAAYRRLLLAGRLERPVPAIEEKTFHYRDNPFMGPAFAKELSNDKLRGLLSDSIR